jgi:hypothetical protein
MINTTQKETANETYKRDYVEVQVKGRNGRWFVRSRNCKTYDDALAQIANDCEYNRNLMRFIDTGTKSEIRIVRVRSTCEVLA